MIGGVTAAAAAETGLREGTPVVAGGADTQLGLLGIGVTQPGRFTVVGGTFWQCTVVLDEPLVDPQARLRTLCHTVPDRWMMEGIGFYCGIVMRWFRDAFCELESAEAERTGEDVYAVMERKAASVPPGSNGVFGIFSNVMQASRWVHASPSFVGFDVANPVPAGRIECFRAIEESAAYVDARPPADRRGGRWHRGARRRPHRRRREGHALAADRRRRARGPGLDPGREGVDRARRRASTPASAPASSLTLPQPPRRSSASSARSSREPAAAAAYAALYEQWLELYRRSLELSEAGLVRPLWRAAGT